MKPLQPPDTFHLSAALRWLELGNWQEANEDLEKITPEWRAHPAVLSVRWHIFAKAGKWDLATEVAKVVKAAFPELADSWINLAFSTRRKTGGGVKLAKEILVEAQKLFPKEPMIAFNLACYCCQLKDLKGAWAWLEKAIDLGDPKKVKLMALKDPDLEPMWADISEI